jgi:hypothetical protein
MIDSSGNYTAPDVAPSPPIVRVVATSITTPAASGSATIVVGTNSNNAKLNGHYAFLLQGYDGDGNVAIAGDFVADGNGNITSGIADYDFSSGILFVQGAAFSGTYSVGPDSRGSMTITGGFASGLSQTFTFALSSIASGVASRGRLVEVDNNDIWAGGMLAKQDQAAFSQISLNGDFAFSLGGTSATGFRLVAIGRMTANAGTLTNGESDMFGLGVAFDGTGAPAPSTDLPFSGTCAVADNGRGAALLKFSTQDPGFSSFSFYVISANEFWLIETDSSSKAGISGVALRQAGGPFSAASLTGSAVLNLTGDPGKATAGGAVEIGLASFDGSGGVSGAMQRNDAGVVTADSAFDGSYTLDADGLGRGEIILNGDPQPKPFYLVSTGTGFIIETSGSAGAGMFEKQTSGPFSDGSLSDNYELGSLPWPMNWVFSPGSGILSFDGAGDFNAVLDGKDGNGDGSGSRMVGDYSVEANGKAFLTMSANGAASPTSWTMYLISPTKAVAIRIDPGSSNHAIRVLQK